MATEKGEDIPARPPIPGDLPYREPPVIEGKAEEIHETRFEPTNPPKLPQANLRLPRWMR